MCDFCLYRSYYYITLAGNDRFRLHTKIRGKTANLYAIRKCNALPQPGFELATFWLQSGRAIDWAITSLVQDVARRVKFSNFNTWITIYLCMSENCEFDFIYNNFRDILTFLRCTICYFSNYRLIQFMGNVFFDQNRFKKYGVQKLPSHNATVKIYYLRYMIRSRRHEASDIWTYPHRTAKDGTV